MQRLVLYLESDVSLTSDSHKFILYKLTSLFSTTQKIKDPWGQHIYIQEQCTTFDIDKNK